MEPIYRYETQNLIVNERDRSAVLDGKTLLFKGAAFDYLCAILRRPGEVIKYGELTPKRAKPQENVRNNNTYYLRQALGSNLANYIKTHRNLGLSWQAEVKRTLLGHKNIVDAVREGSPVSQNSDLYFGEHLKASRHIEVRLVKNKRGEICGYSKIALTSEGVSLLRREANIYALLKNTDAKSVILEPIYTRLDSDPAIIVWPSYGIDFLEFSDNDGLISLTRSQRIELFRKITFAVSKLHDEKIVHADLKPANILIDKNEVRLIDFTHAIHLPSWKLVGVEKKRDLSSSLQTHADNINLRGSINYIAPEIYEGKAEPSYTADVYALGRLYYQILSNSLEKLWDINWRSEVADSTIISDISAMTAVDPNMRPENASEVIHLLNTLNDRQSLAFASVKLNEELEETKAALEKTRARRPWLILAGLSLSFALIASLWSYHRVSIARDEAVKSQKAAHEAREFMEKILRTASPENNDRIRDATVSDALVYASELLKDGTIEDPQNRITIYYNLINIAVSQKDWDNALNLSRDLLDFLTDEAPTHIEDRITARLYYAEYLKRFGDTESSDEQIQLAQQDIELLEAPSPEILGRVSFMEGRRRYFKANYEQAIPPLEAALESFSKYDADGVNLIGAYIALADSYLQTSRPGDALHTIEEAVSLDFVQSGRIPPNLMTSLRAMQARVYSANDMLPDAIDILEQQIELAQDQSPGTWREGAIHAEIGDLADKIGDHRRAFDAFTNAERIGCASKELPDWFCPYLTASVATQALYLGDVEESVAGYRKAAATIKPINETAWHYVSVGRVRAEWAAGNTAIASELLTEIDFAKARSLGDDGNWTAREASLREVIEYAPSSNYDNLRAGERRWVERYKK